MKVVIGIIIAVIIALVVGFVPIMDVPYTVTVQYQDTETYYEDEPYEGIETYTETVPLDYEVVKSYTDLDSYEVWRSNAGDVEIFFPIGCVSLKNTDSAVGTVNFQFTFYQLIKMDVEVMERLYGHQPIEELVKTAGSKYNGRARLTLEPSKTETIRYSFEGAIEDKLIWDYYLWDWEYTITEATKSVEMERTITKYRQVEKQRTVTKERTETHYKKVPIFEYLLSRF